MITVEYHRKIILKSKIFTKTRRGVSFRVCDFSSCNLLTETNDLFLGTVFLLYFVSETILVRMCSAFLYSLRNTQLYSRPRSSIVVIFLTTINIFNNNRNNDSLSGCDLCFYNLLFDTNNSVSGTILLSYLVSEPEKSTSRAIELKILFPNSDLLHFFLYSKNTHAKFGAYRLTFLAL
jgi:hypothetical protein